MMDFEKLEEEIVDLLYSISTEKGKRLLNEELCLNISEEIMMAIKEKAVSCPLYVDYEKSCEALKKHKEELKPKSAFPTIDQALKKVEG